jgi:hypothetical protein
MSNIINPYIGNGGLSDENGGEAYSQRQRPHSTPGNGMFHAFCPVFVRFQFKTHRVRSQFQHIRAQIFAAFSRIWQSISAAIKDANNFGGVVQINHDDSRDHDRHGCPTKERLAGFHARHRGHQE